MNGSQKKRRATAAVVPLTPAAFFAIFAGPRDRLAEEIRQRGIPEYAPVREWIKTLTDPHQLLAACAHWKLGAKWLRTALHDGCMVIEGRRYVRFDGFDDKDDEAEDDAGIPGWWIRLTIVLSTWCDLRGSIDPTPLHLFEAACTDRAYYFGIGRQVEDPATVSPSYDEIARLEATARIVINRIRNLQHMEEHVEYSDILPTKKWTVRLGISLDTLNRCEADGRLVPSLNNTTRLRAYSKKSLAAFNKP